MIWINENVSKVKIKRMRSFYIFQPTVLNIYLTIDYLVNNMKF